MRRAAGAADGVAPAALQVVGDPPGVSGPGVGNAKRRGSPLVLLFGGALGMSAGLMFLLEPMAAKMVLPLLGGAPSVWNTCVVFFQGMLLAGYAYAHGAPRWLGIRRHAALHAALVLGSTAALPWAFQLRPPGDGADPVGWLLLVLLTSIGLPFFLLATSAPLLQRWFSRTGDHASGDPYFLYAASNVGSLLGLLMYPVVVEPLLPLALQSRYWKFGYVVFALGTAACALSLHRRMAAEGGEHFTEEAAVGAADRPSVWRRMRWVALAFAPSSLMLAVTTYVSTDIAAVPLLWVLPLALYLLTFVMAFGGPARRSQIVDRALPVLVLVLALYLILNVTGPVAAVIPVHLLVFFLAALMCHRALADDRPHPAHLTGFYLLVALGGVLGSLFNTLAAPMLFTGIVEYPAVLVLVCLLRTPADGGRRPPASWRMAGPVLVGFATIAAMTVGSRTDSLPLQFVLLGVPAFLCLSLSRTGGSFAAAVGAMLLVSAFRPDPLGQVLHAERTFFGAYKVRTEPGGAYRTLAHGTTLHGVQSVAPEGRSEPLSYYHRTGPLGDIMASLPAARHPRVGVVGLGVGSVAAFRQPSQAWTFFEIDPAVERLARRSDYFSYLDDCTTACRVVIGDARLSLAADPTTYGVLVLDAFSSDAIPVHLVTREALALYLDRLAPGGVLAFHVSNRHLNLEPVLARLAEQAGLVALIRRDRLEKDVDGKRSSDWLVMARAHTDVQPLLEKPGWVPARVRTGIAAWTDDFSNVVELLLLPANRDS